MHNGTLKWCSITTTLRILLSATLPWRFPVKQQHKEGTFFPLINLSDAQQRSASSPLSSKFWLLHSIDVQPPWQRGEALDKGSFVPQLLWGRARAQWRFSLMSDIVTPACSENHSHIRIPQLALRLRFPLLTQFSRDGLKRSALAAQRGIKVAVQSRSFRELIN